MPVKLHVNVDHVATLRQARGTSYPDPVHAAIVCERAGADGITVHLREDRRHIQDRDVAALREVAGVVLNLEMAATDEMVAYACRIRPDLVTLVPEKREERTTEGGLDVIGQGPGVGSAVRRLSDAGIPVSLFIDPESSQVRAAVELGAAAIELHTGDYANASRPRAAAELDRLASAASEARRASASLVVAAGHGLHLRNVGALIAVVPEVVELNIGHALVADAVFLGLAGAVTAYRSAIAAGEGARS